MKRWALRASSDIVTYNGSAVAIHWTVTPVRSYNHLILIVELPGEGQISALTHTRQVTCTLIHKRLKPVTTSMRVKVSGERCVDSV